MQRIWAAAATVWAVLGVTAALAWTQAQHSAPLGVPAPSTASVKAGTAGTAQRRRPARRAAPHATTHTS